MCFISFLLGWRRKRRECCDLTFEFVNLDVLPLSIIFEPDYSLLEVVEIVKFFRTGKTPIDPQETLELYAFMEAADESKRRGGETVSIAEVMKKAKAEAGLKN